MSQPYARFIGDGSAKTFIYGFDVLDEAQIEVYIDGVKQTSDYSIDTTQKFVTFTTAPANGADIIIFRNSANAPEDYDFTKNKILKAKSLQDALDYIRQLAEEARYPHYPVNDDDAATKEYTDEKHQEAIDHSDANLSEAKSYTDTKHTEAIDYTDTKHQEALNYVDAKSLISEQYVDNKIVTDAVHKLTDTEYGADAVNKFKIVNVSSPEHDYDAANKAYADYVTDAAQQFISTLFNAGVIDGGSASGLAGTEAVVDGGYVADFFTKTIDAGDPTAAATDTIDGGALSF